jgi:hypothetical protein
MRKFANSNLSGEIFDWQTSEGALKTTLQGHLEGVLASTGVAGRSKLLRLIGGAV